MSNDKIRIGIIGANAQYGWGMRAHLPAILALPDYELTAVCTSRPDTSQESKKAYGAGMAFHDFREMVKHPDIDLVSVSVRVPWHYDMVIAALEAGKHVFCESPLGANLAETEEMAALARAKGVRHMVSLQARGAPAVLHLRDLLAQGYVGEVLACNMTMFYPGLLQRGRDMAWMADRKMGADTLAGVTCHVIDILCYCVGEFRDLSAKVATQVPEWETRGSWKESFSNCIGQCVDKRRAGRRGSGLGPRRQRTLAWYRVEDGGLRTGRHGGGFLPRLASIRKHPTLGGAG